MAISLETIIPVITVIVSYIFGILAKKFNWYETKYIPIQNGIIGIVSAIIYYIAMPDSNFITVLFTALSGFVAGGLYDVNKTSSNE